MKVIIQNIEYRILFYYNGNETICRIVDNANNIICEASSHCNIIDTYNRDVGRKLSLTRALNLEYDYIGLYGNYLYSEHLFDKLARTKFWLVYNNWVAKNKSKSKIDSLKAQLNKCTDEELQDLSAFIMRKEVAYIGDIFEQSNPSK